MAANNDLMGRVLGVYEDDCPVDHYKAMRAVLPPHYSSVKRLRWDSTQGKLRHIFFTDRGTFYGPIIRRIEPNELAVDSCSERVHRTFQVKLLSDFDLLNVLCVDHEHQIVAPVLEFKFPFLIRESEPVTFEFKIPYDLRGKTK